MKVTVLFFASLREQLGQPRADVDLPASVNTVGGLRDHLRARGGAWATELAPGRAVRVAVNHDLADADTPIAPDDEVAIFPPVTGG